MTTTNLINKLVRLSLIAALFAVPNLASAALVESTTVGGNQLNVC